MTRSQPVDGPPILHQGLKKTLNVKQYNIRIYGNIKCDFSSEEEASETQPLGVLVEEMREEEEKRSVLSRLAK